MRGSIRAHLWSLGVGIALLPGVPWAGAARPSAEAIAEAVRGLASPDAAARRKAQELLVRAGAAALPALQAAESCDADVVNRIARIVVAIRFGLDDDAPRVIAELVNQYRYGDGEAAAEAVAKLAGEREDGLRVLRAIAATTIPAPEPQQKPRRDDDDDRPQVEFGERVYQRVPDVARAGSFGELEWLLRIAAARGGDEPVCDLVTFHLLRGTLDAELARAEEALAAHAGQKGSPLAKKAASFVAYLYRAKGQIEKAREAAVRWGLDELADGLAAELGRWQDLREFRRDLTELGDDLGALGRVAAYHRVLGGRKLFESLAARIRACVEKRVEIVWPRAKAPLRRPRPRENAWPAAKVLVLNRRAEDAISILLDQSQVWCYQRAVGFLEQRQEFARAFEAVEKAKAAGGELAPWAEVWLAAFAARRDGPDKGRAALADVGRRAAERADWNQVRNVVEQERKLGFTKEAIEHTAAAIAAAAEKKDDDRGRNQPDADVFLNALFGARGKEAVALWPSIRPERPGEGEREALERLDGLLADRPAAPLLDALAAKAEGFAATLEPEPRAEFLDAVAEACARLGRTEQAIEWFERRCKVAAAPAPLMRIAELRVGQAKWAEAAAAFGRAWEAARDNPAPLYLQGWALGKAGHDAAGRAKRDLARLLPLGRDKVRRDLAHALAAHGLKEESIAEHALILITAPSTMQMPGDTYTLMDEHAYGQKDYARAALLIEREIFAVYELNWYFLEDDQYLGIPARAQLRRAHARLAEGKVEQAMEEARLCLDVLPACWDLALALVPELEKAGRVKEADELFGRVYDALDKACQFCPHSAATHNSLAWLAARCRRRLDAALEHARRAVELEPNSAAFVDTLAETHFQRGELDKAVEAGQRALDLGKDKYHRDQLDRFRSAREARKAH
ncbi:MAG: hypothetical protein FJ291_01860 [Planctomycetes bacterium]|nr:hypothetical protein [Planctomycetota bacterium]